LGLVLSVQQKPLPVPLYLRVYGVIFQRMQHGAYPAGSALPTEDRLAAEFGVSKATVRQAVGALVDRGLVVRRQGKGTFVQDDPAFRPAHAFVGSFPDLIIGTHSLSVREESVERDVSFPSDVLALLEMTETHGMVLRHHRDLDGAPFAYVVVYIAPLVDRYVNAEEIPATGRVTLLHRRGLKVVGSQQSMAAELADVEVARHLGLDFGAPVLFAQRIVKSVDGPIEVVHTWYRGDLYKWEADLIYTWVDNSIVVSVSSEVHASDVHSPSGAVAG
jgi:GntR family transcriptional regulator